MHRWHALSQPPTPTSLGPPWGHRRSASEMLRQAWEGGGTARKIRGCSSSAFLRRLQSGVPLPSICRAFSSPQSTHTCPLLLPAVSLQAGGGTSTPQMRLQLPVLGTVRRDRAMQPACVLRPETAPCLRGWLPGRDSAWSHPVITRATRLAGQRWKSAS